MEQTIIFKSPIQKFSARIWKLSFPLLILYCPLLVIPLYLLFIENVQRGIFMFVTFAFVLLPELINSYKWSLRKISTIAYSSDAFEINFMDKDTLCTVKISKNNIKTSLNWRRGGAPRGLVRVLTISDGDTTVLQLYSGGRRDEEYLLEEIALQIKITLSASP